MPPVAKWNRRQQFDDWVPQNKPVPLKLLAK